MSDSGMDGTMGGGMGPDGTMGHQETSPVVDGARRIEVTATSFEFDPDAITITAGEDIAIVLTSEDLLHDFTIDELDAHVAADANETNEGGLRADEPGRYAYYCTVAGHRAAGMEGTLIVEAP
jgi:plastocyanin